MATPWRGARPLAAAALLGLVLAPAARAGLFDDDEARKAILDLRARVQASEDAQKARLAELQKLHVDENLQRQAALDQARRRADDLTTQIEALRAEQAKLRGEYELQARTMAELQKKLNEALAALDDRVKTMEPQQVSLDGKVFAADPAERRAYEQATRLLRDGEFDKAAAALSAFLGRYPSSGYADASRFWLGQAQYGQKNHKEAIATFRALIAAAPAHPRVPEALLAVASAQAEAKDVKGARKTLEDLIRLHPSTEAAEAARERLAALKG